MLVRKTDYRQVLRTLLDWSEHVMRCDLCLQCDPCGDALCPEGRHISKEFLETVDAWRAMHDGGRSEANRDTAA